MSWFDDHKNSTGALSTRLAMDASQVQGVCRPHSTTVFLWLGLGETYGIAATFKLSQLQITENSNWPEQQRGRLDFRTDGSIGSQVSKRTQDSVCWLWAAFSPQNWLHAEAPSLVATRWLLGATGAISFLVQWKKRHTWTSTAKQTPFLYI